MTVSKAKLEANKRHMNKLDVIKIQPPKEVGQRIREHAKAADTSVQKYILNAVTKQMDSEDERHA